MNTIGNNIPTTVDPGRVVIRKSRLAQAAAMLALTLALGGCLSSRSDSLMTGSVNSPVHSERHPIAVRTGLVELKIEVLRHMAALSPNQSGKVAGFVRGYKSIGAGPLTIMVPRGGRNEIAATRAMDTIREILDHEGVPPRAVRSMTYSASPGQANPPVVMKYSRYYATPSKCGNWPGNLAAEFENKPYPNFACASRNNLAAMVANPRDLVVPRTMTPSDTGRRMTVYEKYLKGEVTSAARSDDEKSTVSNVAK
ncbi:MAG TPA: hypothetical protein ENK41_04770 [Rhodobacteraceae bacterium]|nr:hypothetical protein [Paracoccaceae bacterium]